MSFFVKMNERLDKGWKLTDIFCPICTGNILASPDLKEYYCIKCDLPAKIVPDAENKIDGEEENKEVSYQKETPPPQIKRPDPSSKIAEKLVQGWTLTEQSCPECEVTPLVRSKKSGYFCVTCNKYLELKDPKENGAPKRPQSTQTSQPIPTVTQPNPVHDSIPYSKNIQTQNMQERKDPEKLTVAKGLEKSSQSDMFEMNINNHRALMKLINTAATKLANSKEESNIEIIFQLLNAQKKIDESQQELLRVAKSS